MQILLNYFNLGIGEDKMPEAPKPEQTQGMDIAAVLNNPEVKKFYINRTLVGNTVSDMFVIAQSLGTTPTVIQLSFNTAKTLAMDILGMISQIENQTGQKILTVRDIQDATTKTASGAQQ
jgi:hypothetical protein